MRFLTRGEMMARQMFRASTMPFAVTGEHGVTMELTMHATRDDAYAQFQTLGRDPAYDKVALHVAQPL